MVEAQTYSVAILDDDECQAADIAAMVGMSSCVGTCDPVSVFGGDVALDAFIADTPRFDILIADINLGEGREDAISFVRRVFPAGSGVQVIYVTGYADEYHTGVYKTDHVYFLAKPFTQEDLDDALEKACANLREQLNRPLSITFGRATYLIQPSRVLYVESVRRKVRIVADDQIVETYVKIKDVKEVLPSCFLQCHKSFLVNMARVLCLEKDSLTLLDGTKIPVSQKRRADVRISLARYARSLA